MLGLGFRVYGLGWLTWRVTRNGEEYEKYSVTSGLGFGVWGCGSGLSLFWLEGQEDTMSWPTFGSTGVVGLHVRTPTKSP